MMNSISGSVTATSKLEAGDPNPPRKTRRCGAVSLSSRPVSSATVIISTTEPGKKIGTARETFREGRSLLHLADGDGHSVGEYLVADRFAGRRASDATSGTPAPHKRAEHAGEIARARSAR